MGLQASRRLPSLKRVRLQAPQNKAVQPVMLPASFQGFLKGICGPSSVHLGTHTHMRVYVCIYIYTHVRIQLQLENFGILCRKNTVNLCCFRYKYTRIKMLFFNNNLVK